jgi:hypothetical protein
MEFAAVGAAFEELGAQPELVRLRRAVDDA